MSDRDVIEADDVRQVVADRRWRGAANRRQQPAGATAPAAGDRADAGDAARVQGVVRAGVPGRQAARVRLEHLEDRRSHRHAAQQSLQEARAVRHQAGDRRVDRDLDVVGSFVAITAEPSSSVVAGQTTAGLRRALRPASLGSAGRARQLERFSGLAAPKREGGRREESPNSSRAVRRVIPGRGNSKDSGTENIPPALVRLSYGVARPDQPRHSRPSAPGQAGRSPGRSVGASEVRVKRCGKSAPRLL